MTETTDRKKSIPSPLSGRAVALPESRQLDILADLFERRGAAVMRVPLVSILDAPDPAPIRNWLTQFIAHPPHHLIILTGEGLRRLAGFAQRAGCREEFVQTLSSVDKLCRGPKPGRALKELGLQPDRLGKEPTTGGIIATLDEMPIAGLEIGVQLYGEDPNTLLMDYLRGRGATVRAVAPYIYAPRSDADKVLALISDLAAGRVDVIAFTSQPQFSRLLSVAREADCEADLFAGLARTTVAAVGPVVADQLGGVGIRVDISPQDAFFMKPMVTEIERHLQKEQPG